MSGDSVIDDYPLAELELAPTTAVVPGFRYSPDQLRKKKLGQRVKWLERKLQYQRKMRAEQGRQLKAQWDSKIESEALREAALQAPVMESQIIETQVIENPGPSREETRELRAEQKNRLDALRAKQEKQFDSLRAEQINQLELPQSEQRHQAQLIQTQQREQAALITAIGDKVQESNRVGVKAAELFDEASQLNRETETLQREVYLLNDKSKNSTRECVQATQTATHLIEENNNLHRELNSTLNQTSEINDYSQELARDLKSQLKMTREVFEEMGSATSDTQGFSTKSQKILAELELTQELSSNQIQLLETSLDDTEKNNQIARELYSQLNNLRESSEHYDSQNKDNIDKGNKLIQQLVATSERLEAVASTSKNIALDTRQNNQTAIVVIERASRLNREMESSLSENSQLNQQLQESLDHGKHEIQSLHNLMSECRTLCGESVTVINTGKQLNENTASSLDKIQQVAERQIVQEREIATLADLTNEISNNSKNLLHTLATNHHESLILQAESKQLNKESVLNIEKNTYFISQLQKELEKLKGVNTDYQEKLTAADNQVQLVTQEQRRFKKLYDRALKEISSKEIAARNARESLRESSEIIKSFHKTLADFQQSQLQSQSIISESQQNIRELMANNEKLQRENYSLKLKKEQLEITNELKRDLSVNSIKPIKTQADFQSVSFNSEGQIAKPSVPVNSSSKRPIKLSAPTNIPADNTIELPVVSKDRRSPSPYYKLMLLVAVIAPITFILYSAIQSYSEVKLSQNLNPLGMVKESGNISGNINRVFNNFYRDLNLDNNTLASAGVLSLSDTQEGNQYSRPTIKQFDPSRNPPATTAKIQFQWPLAESSFKPADILYDTTRKGINIMANIGEEVRAVSDGEVIYSDTSLKDYGNIIMIRHSDELISVYASNLLNRVKTGDTVKRGQLIANVGRLFNGTSSGLYFEVRYNGKAEDPFHYLPREG